MARIEVEFQQEITFTVPVKVSAYSEGPHMVIKCIMGGKLEQRVSHPDGRYSSVPYNYDYQLPNWWIDEELMMTLKAMAREAIRLELEKLRKENGDG